ncbi:MAG: 2-oxoacid:acceptor oxidoreductase family protein [Deltaproteobacteria bacterium]|nr:2-oxoacid:acceptor oxidoreductase family protein [Candidatus Anaeroferrophillus wilburensis]MBN2888815.1 2-oxoacid:acceptor oxidoreductase family protein [Deltaproteobacteria bacterium]
MLEIRIHGRGGQGAVIASQILSYAFFIEGKFAQSFPTFGAERRGAPVAAYVRLADAFIDLRSQVVNPDYVMVMAARLAESVPVTGGIKAGGLVFINSDRPAAYYSFFKEDCRVATMNINEIALQHRLGSPTMPLINAPMLGAFARLTGLVALESLVAALPHFIPVKHEENEQAMRAAFVAAPSVA